MPRAAATGDTQTFGPEMTLRGHGNVVKSALFGPGTDAAKSAVFSVGFDGKAMRWETSTYAEVKVLAASMTTSKDVAGEKLLEQHGDEVLAVAFDGAGKRAVTAIGTSPRWCGTWNKGNLSRSLWRGIRSAPSMPSR